MHCSLSTFKYLCDKIEGTHWPSSWSPGASSRQLVRFVVLVLVADDGVAAAGLVELEVGHEGSSLLPGDVEVLVGEQPEPKSQAVEEL